MPTEADDLDAGVLASVECVPPGASAQRLALWRLADADALRGFWEARLEDVEAGLEPDDEACNDGRAGYRKWGFGSIACLVDDDAAEVRWTDQRTQSFGAVTSSSGDLAGLVEWWRTTARPLGRSTEGPATEPQEPVPSTTPRPLVRVPGQPRAIICGETAAPIIDKAQRRWRIRNIEFRDRGNYDRVILNLLRTGRNRSGGPTQALVERMPLAAVAERVEGASRPGRGRTAIVVRLDGVPAAPDIQRFRPNATDLVRELSVVRTDGSSTVIISTPPDTCYQLRIPVWGPRASGTERRAEVFIDLVESPGG